MSKTNTIITITKLVIETQSPMAISTGNRETGFDSKLIRDMYGLPIIPATAIAGVWSHLIESEFGKSLKEKWFGNAKGIEAVASHLSISNGCLLNSKGQSVPLFSHVDRFTNDPLLELCLRDAPHYRDGVAINDRGVAKEGAKYDQIVLPKGLRFEVQLQWSNRRDEQNSLHHEEWYQLLSLWLHPRFAFGANTRNGLGRVSIVKSEEQRFCLNKGASIAKELNTFRQKSVLKTHQLANKLQTNTFGECIQIHLQALDVWRCGTGSALFTAAENQSDHSVNIISYSEPVITWNHDNATIEENIPVLCGSSIKGMLAHRIAYHYRKHKGDWAEKMTDTQHEEWEKRPIELKELLGHADEDNHDDSLAGSMWVFDAQVKNKDGQSITAKDVLIRHHNSIDRFTGGVRKGALYQEELLFKPRFTIELHLNKALSEFSSEIQQALKATLSDLKLGLLPMGAGSGRGTSLVMEVAE